MKDASHVAGMQRGRVKFEEDFRKYHVQPFLCVSWTTTKQNGGYFSLGLRGTSQGKILACDAT
jgi:hypothetical protein